MPFQLHRAVFTWMMKLFVLLLGCIWGHLCVIHTSANIVEVKLTALHGLSCRWSEGHFAHHAALNEIIYQSLQSVNVPSRLEPADLYILDGRHPN